MYLDGAQPKRELPEAKRKMVVSKRSEDGIMRLTVNSKQVEHLAKPASADKGIITAHG